MKIRRIDLYEAFGMKKPEGAEGILTCWLPELRQEVNESRILPAVLVLPGGGYAMTSAREKETVAMGFTSRGFAAFVLEYSVAPAVYPTALRESAMAMVYIRKNADMLGIDPHKVAAMGFSAGGHLCGTLGMLYGSEAVADIGSEADIRPDALGLCYPVAVAWGNTHQGSFRNLTGSQDPAVWQKYSLDKLVRADMPPVFLWTTRDDQTVPCRNSLVLAQALEEKGVDFVLHVYRRGRHGLGVANALVYPASAVPENSWDVPGWLESLSRFFMDCGLTIED